MTGSFYQDLIRKRYSARRYLEIAIPSQVRGELQSRLEAIHHGPLGTPLRFNLAAAGEEDSQALRGLGTYGFIHHPAGFIIGAAQEGPHALEDYGFAMELAVLEATALGLGTCWLGGTFNKSNFARRIALQPGEILPAVAAAGYAEAEGRARDPLRALVRAGHRRLWDSLFFEMAFGQPLARSAAGEYTAALEMLRLAPSASNKQPWRVVRQGARWHFYAQRTPGYAQGLVSSLLKLADMQRMDIGIAMCHFELTARERGLPGAWVCADPGLPLPDGGTFYVASWEEASLVADSS